MRNARPPILALLLACAVPLSAGSADAPAVVSATSVTEEKPAALEPGPVIDPAQADEAWSHLFARLRDQGAVFSTFTERRWLSVKKEPVELHGELRHSPERGLSLRYTEPDEQMMIVDEKGILLRNDSGRSRALRTDPRAPQVDAMLLHILRFDLPALQQIFEIHAARLPAEGAIGEATTWRLDFVPREQDMARAVGRMVVEGRGEAVRRLEFRRGSRQRIEVTIEETHTGVTFSPEDVGRYFR